MGSGPVHRHLVPEKVSIMRRLRQRLNGLEAHAHATMGSTDVLLAAMNDLVADLADGVEIELTIPKIGNLLFDALIDKWGGKLPFTLRIDPREEQK